MYGCLKAPYPQRNPSDNNRYSNEFQENITLYISNLFQYLNGPQGWFDKGFVDMGRLKINKTAKMGYTWTMSTTGTAVIIIVNPRTGLDWEYINLLFCRLKQGKWGQRTSLLLVVSAWSSSASGRLTMCQMNCSFVITVYSPVIAVTSKILISLRNHVSGWGYSRLTLT